MSFGPEDVISCPTLATKVAILLCLGWVAIACLAIRRQKQILSTRNAIGLSLLPLLVGCANAWLVGRNIATGTILFGRVVPRAIAAASAEALSTFQLSAWAALA